jgi:regulator of sirC expression with transglutaminase-like and TPR domain
MRFADLAAAPDARIEDLALALAAALRDDVDREAARARLDGLAGEVAVAVVDAGGGAEAQLGALAGVLHGRHGFAGDDESYDDPRNSYLDVVLERGRGLPITLSVLYVAVAHRAGIALAGFGLPGHFVAGHVGVAPPLLVDPFGGGRRVPTPPGAQPWTAHATAMRMLNNLVGSFGRRGDVGAAIRAAELRLALPSAGGEREALEVEARALRARLN